MIFFFHFVLSTTLAFQTPLNLWHLLQCYMAFYQTPVFLIGTTENLKCWTTGLWRHHLECLETHSLTSSLSTYKLEVLNGHAATPSTRLPCTEHYSMFWHKPWDIFMITFLFLVHSEVCEEETSSWCWQYTKYQTCHTIHHLDSCSLYIFTQVWSFWHHGSSQHI